MKYLQMISEANSKVAEEDNAKREEEERVVREESVKQALVLARAKAKASLPVEPVSGQMIQIAFRLPDGSRQMRNFMQTDPLSVSVE